ncbi:MAG: hypothetical protein B7Z80_25825 [Rhodospirillales bacterium 20-64-7]|nr:MAG: hypothetical protein B7Z80_25825 [Rhodospirillales bacterium 20-64-7]
MKKLFILTPLLAPLVLAACGTLPEPFYGNPGREGAMLATPPAPVLIIPPPGRALLGDDAAKRYADDLATALLKQDVPSLAAPAAKNQWTLEITAKLAGNNVLPAYTVIGPDHHRYGTDNGAPVPATGWANGDPATLQQAADTDAAPLEKTLAAINARVQQSNPNSLENRTPRLFLGPVTGAPGDGDHALALDLSRDLPSPDLTLTPNPKHADFAVTGQVKASPVGKGQILVELDWTITDSNHRKIGQVTQLHQLAPTDITPYWGDVAAAAATEAAHGIQQVVTNAILKRK